MIDIHPRKHWNHWNHWNHEWIRSPWSKITMLFLFRSPWESTRGFHNHGGTPNSWMVYFMENPKIKWMIFKGFWDTPNFAISTQGWGTVSIGIYRKPEKLWWFSHGDMIYRMFHGASGRCHVGHGSRWKIKEHLRSYLQSSLICWKNMSPLTWQWYMHVYCIFGLSPILTPIIDI